MINLSLNCNKVFRVKVEKCSSLSFAARTIETIKYCLRKNNTCVMALIMFYENNVVKPKKLYRVLSYVLYSLIDNYACIDYLSCQPKTLRYIYSKPTFEDTSFNILLGIIIPELLLNLLSCHGFMKKPNSTVILKCQSRLINNYLAKGFYIIEKDSNQLSFLPNDVKLRINVIYQLDTNFFMAKNKAIFSVANTIKKLHTQKNMHLINKQDFYKDKRVCS